MYSVSITQEQFDRDEFSANEPLLIYDWTVEQFGPHTGPFSETVRWYYNYYGTYYFRDEADAMLFKLRWY